MKVSNIVLLGVSLLLFSACAKITENSEGQKMSPKYMAFKARDDYRKTYNVYKNEKVLSEASRDNTSVKIDLSDQRAQLLVDGKIALDTPCCTGKSGKKTPSGSFRITEKIVTKRSTLFGSLYRKGKKVYGGDKRKYRGSYDKYVGAALPYWMRLTGDGIGMHLSKGVKRYPASNGCIRMPAEPVKTIFSKTKVGTPVQVVP